MTKQQLIDLHILCNQNEVVEELMKNGLIENEILYSDEEVLEWWLITPFFADCLRQEKELVIESLGCHWWGRTTSGQAIYIDNVISDIANRI